jgi:hypothetical protein
VLRFGVFFLPFAFLNDLMMKATPVGDGGGKSKQQKAKRKKQAEALSPIGVKLRIRL